jgi:hypothetical protein
MRKGLGKVASLAASKGEDVFVTSIRDSNHSLGSLHYDGNAVDIRPLHTVTIDDIKVELGIDFDVVDETNHWHLEFDPGI